MFGSHSDNALLTCRIINARSSMGRFVSLQAAGVLSILLLLAGCAGVPPDSAQAAKMSLQDAEWDILNSSMTDFLSSGIMTGEDPASLVSCRYEELNPTVYENGGRTIVDWGSQCRKTAFPAGQNAEAQHFASALLRWKKSTPEERQIWQAVQHQQFVISAVDYRAANPKPVIPEEVRRFKVLAEAAVHEKRYSAAARAYEFGVIIAPWWPEGHFNAALMLGEIHHNDAAIDHMRKYLILKPDASDARMAQDQIYTWGGGALPPASELTPSVQIGISFKMLSPEQAAALQKPDLKGALVETVKNGSVAEKAGISKGDVIVKYGDKPIVSQLDLPAAVIATKPGSAVQIKVIRGAQELILTAQY